MQFHITISPAKQVFLSFFSKTLIPLVLIICSTAQIKAQMADIKLSGAGTAAVNGVYTYMGQHTTGDGWGGSYSADYYQKGSIYIYRLSFVDWPGGPLSHWWRIGSSLGANGSNSIYYTVKSTQTYATGLTFSHSSGLGSGSAPTAELNSNIWNGSAWSGGSAPGTADDVSLSSNTSPGSFGAKNLDLESGIDLTIGSGETVTISGDIGGVAPVSLNGSLTNFTLSGASSNLVNGAGGSFTGTGSPANGLNFDGSDDYVSIEDNAVFDFSSGLTAEVWVKPDNFNSHASLVSKFSNNEREFSLLLLSSGKMEYSITFNGSSEEYFGGSTTLTAGNWYHIALTYDGSTMRAYINGVADGTKSVSGTIHNGSSDLYIGVRGENSLSRYFDGTIDEVRIWNTARSQADIQANMNGELTGNEANLISYFNFNQGTADGSNSGETSLNNTKVVSYDPNVISGSGTLIFDNSGETLSLSNVKLNMEGVVQISSGTTLQTNDSLTLTASSASSYGQIIGDGTVLGNVTSQAYMDVSSARYHYLGSPFTDATLQEFNEGQTMVAANNGSGTIWQWNASSASWEAPSSLSDVAANGRGYTLYAGTNAYGTFLMSGNGVSELDGTVASGDIAVALGYNDGQAAGVSFTGGSGQSSTEGWNFLANPYPSQYDWNGQTLPAGMSNAFYVNKGGSYASYVSGVGTNGGTQYLAPFQGFWVQTSNSSPGNFTFEQDQRVTAPSTALMKTSPIDGVYLSVSDSLTSDQLFIGFDNSASSGFDAALDARKLLNGDNIPNLYASLGGETYSICRVPLSSKWSIPLKLDFEQNGKALSISPDLSQLQSFGQVLVEDRKLNITYDLSAGDYHFIHDIAFGPDRFILHFGQPSIGVEGPVQQPVVYGYANGHGLNVELGALHNATVEVYNMAGQLVDSKEKLNGKASFDVKDRGLYILKVSADDFSQCLKVIR